MKCLVCQNPTEERVHEGVTADACLTGHGLWLDPKELLEAMRTDPDASGRGNTFDEQSALFEIIDHDVITDDEVRRCPMCSKPMHSGRYGTETSTNVVVDVCPRHGVWLDSGELEELEAWAASRFAPDSEATKAWERRLTEQDAGLQGETLELRFGFRDTIRALLSRG